MKKRKTAARRKYELKRLIQVARKGVNAIRGETIKKRKKTKSARKEGA